MTECKNSTCTARCKATYCTRGCQVAELRTVTGGKALPDIWVSQDRWRQMVELCQMLDWQLVDLVNDALDDYLADPPPHLPTQAHPWQQLDLLELEHSDG